MLKQSRFNHTYHKEGKTYIFNSQSLAYGVLPEDLYQGALDLVKKLNSGVKDFPDNRFKEAAFALRQSGFLVTNPEAELFFFKESFASQKLYNGHTGITIATTESCNFACPYCYEQLSNHFMNKDVIDNLAAYAEKRASMPGAQSLYITWYGGEPLLPKSLEVVRLLSQRFQKVCSEKEVSYSANMITNGYLLTREIARELAGYGVGHLQITLDGSQATHDANRKLKNGQGTFWKILHNIKECKDLLRISVRMNISTENSGEAEHLKKLLIEEGVMDNPERASFYISPVRSYTASCRNTSCYALTDFYDYELELLKKGINGNGFNVVDEYPTQKINVCGSAISEGSFVVGPDGSLYRCWLDVGRESEVVGRLTREGPQMNRSSKWDQYSPFDNKECNNCNVLPLCMGGCPELNMRPHGQEPNEACCNWKFNLQEYLQLYAEASPLTEKETGIINIV